MSRALERQPVRYLLAGGSVALLYLGLTALLLGVVGLPSALALAIGLGLAVSAHFVLQRRFVFRPGEGEFALQTHEQAVRFAGVVVAQYAVTTAALAVLPGVLGVDRVLVYLASVPVVTACTFVIMRTRLFHHA